MRIIPKAITFAACIILLSSCSKEKSEKEISVNSGGTAKISLQSANDILFPFLIQESNLRQISEYVLNPALITIDGNDNPGELLVSAWQVGSGNTSITYILNSAYRWSNGRRLSTDDIVFTFKVMQVPYFKMRIPGQFKVIRDVEIIDSLSFRINYSRPVADPFYHSKIPVLPAVWEKYLSEPAALLAAYQNEFIGCGPFTLLHSSQDSLVLGKNNFYPGDYPKLDRLVIYFYTSEERLAGRIREANTDLFIDLPFSMINLMREALGYEIRTYPERGYSFIAWNLNKRIFADIKMRRALSIAVDRDALINGILAGYARKIEGPVYPGLQDLNDTLPILPYDPQQAERLLDDAGWHMDESSGVRMRKGKRLEFSMIINRENPVRKEIAFNIKANLAAIGAQVEIVVADWQEIRKVIREKNFDALLLTWVDEDIYDPSQIFHSAGTGYGLNMMSYRSSDADSLIELGLNAMDSEVRKKVWHEFQSTVAGDIPCTFLFNQEIICGLRKSLHEVEVSESGYLISVKEWWLDTR